MLLYVFGWWCPPFCACVLSTNPAVGGGALVVWATGHGAGPSLPFSASSVPVLAVVPTMGRPPVSGALSARGLVGAADAD